MKKNKIIQLFPRESVPVEVYDWFIRLEEGGFKPEDFAEFEIWAKQNPELAAYLPEIEKVWNQISNAKLDVPVGMKNIGQLPPEAVSGQRAPSARVSWAPSYLASGIAGAFLIMAVSMLSSFYNFDSDLPSYATNEEQRHFVTLDDGSTVQLNSSTKIVVDHNRKQRVVHLKSGEAYFTVAKDINRPFIVVSGEASVKAVGTAFNVKQVEKLHSAVTLVEGIIEVSRMTSGDKVETFATLSEKGKQAILFGTKSDIRHYLTDRSGNVESGIHLSEVNADEVISWKDDKLIFSGERLKTAIEALNKHSSHQLVLLDNTVGSEAIFGAFKMGDWQSAVKAIESTYPLRAKRVAPNKTHLLAAK